MGGTNHRLEKLFNPRSVAIIGASDRNIFARNCYAALEQLGFDGDLHLVNRSRTDAFGRPAITCCADIGAPVDAAYICVPAEGVLDAVADAAAAGIQNLAILSSGFGEVGGEGADRQRRLLDYCAAHNMTFLGPNCLGFINNADRTAMGSLAFATSRTSGTVAIISASGAIGTFLNRFGQQQGIDSTHIVCVGNEADVTTADIVDYLLDHPDVRAIAMFIESIKDEQGFRRAADKARRLAKPIVALKLGRAPATADIVKAHTGSLVGDDSAFGDMCAEYGIIRVTTFEDLMITAHIVSSVGVLRSRGIAFITLSGGACGLISDLAADHGVQTPRFNEAAKTRIESVISEFGQVFNPLDLTGAAVRQPSMWTEAIVAAASDPDIGLVVAVNELPSASLPDITGARDAIEQAINLVDVPVGVIGCMTQPINEYGIDFICRSGASFGVNSHNFAMSALGHLSKWSEAMQRWHADRE